MKVQLNYSFWACSLLVVSALVAACEQPAEALIDRKRRENETEINQYITQNNLTATKTAEGVYFIQTKSIPTAQAPKTGDEVRYRYVARRLDGVIVDSSNTDPATIILAGNSTTGITLGRYAGILKLRQGEEGAVLVPADLDGGRVGTLLLPQYSPVRYDLSLISVRTENQQIQDYITANKLTVTTLTSDSIRVVKTLVQPTDSVAITTGKTVTMNYTGRRASNGVVFDSGTGFQVKIGEKRTVTGFENGLTNLRAGEKAKLIFPSTLGYGVQGSPNQDPAKNLLPYTPLVFDIEITKVQ
jgi:FKBP-type peptidyl-prolyl cis-trans isomerase